ncbi:hypothetical protein BXZ70DRAFT_667314 [Cristinia sonorae]|uniref:Uncharacterized protein n=1 Tax=Cristinia sonorae TaxID=1940300 RepID=A0A8K0UVW9_9AGAR|nr:hypothetical protein BXZ70DRAFT_667314 [Cristinia sonorae]
MSRRRNNYYRTICLLYRGQSRRFRKNLAGGSDNPFVRSMEAWQRDSMEEQRAVTLTLVRATSPPDVFPRFPQWRVFLSVFQPTPCDFLSSPRLRISPKACPTSLRMEQRWDLGVHSPHPFVYSTLCGEFIAAPTPLATQYPGLDRLSSVPHDRSGVPRRLSQRHNLLFGLVSWALLLYSVPIGVALGSGSSRLA